MWDMARLKTKICTRHYQACAEFYERVFGLTRLAEWDQPEDKGIILSLGEGYSAGRLEFHHQASGGDFADVGLQFKVDDLPKFLAELPADIDYEGPSDRPWGARYAMLTDPAGVAIVIYDGDAD